MNSMDFKDLNSSNIEQVKTEICEKLKQVDWYFDLCPFIMTPYFDKILMTLHKETIEGRYITPSLTQMFRAFEECPKEKLKIVLLGQDPYPQPNVADGIAFSCSNTGKIEASLRYMLNEVSRTMYNDKGYMMNPDLRRWSNQGILMLNTAFTTQVGKIGWHFELWSSFMRFLFAMLNKNPNNLIFIFLGKKAQAWSNLINEKHHKFFASHPASAAYAHQHIWDSGDLFNKVSNKSEEINGTKIIW